MRRLAAILLLLPTALPAQVAPRAQPVDPALQRDAGQDWFQHGRNVYESAKRSTGATQFDLYNRSVEIFSHYLNNFPRHANAEAAWWYLGQSYYSTGRIEDAKRCFHSLLNRFGTGRYAAAAAYMLAADHFNNRQYALAASLFDKLSKIATKPPDRQRGLYYAAKSNMMLGQKTKATGYFRALLADHEHSNPYRGEASVEYASILAEAGKLEEAMTLLEQVVNSPETQDTRGAAALKAGTVAARLGDSNRSDRYFNIILTTPGMEDYRPDAQIAMMAARFDQKRYREVIQIFTRTLTKSQGEREARRLMIAARSYMMLDRNADALPLFREIERIQPAQSDYAFDATFYRLLCFFRIEGRHVLDQVEAFLDLYLKTRPRDPKIHTALLMKAETLYDEGKPIEAAEAYRNIDPAMLTAKNRPGMLYKRGRCLADANDPDGAAKSLSQFITENPQDERVALALAARGRAYAANGHTAQALADFDLVVETYSDPKLLTLAYLEGATLAKESGQLDAMVTRYLEFLTKVPSADRMSSAKASYWAGWGMVKTNRGAEALPHLKRARELAPDRYEKHAGLLLCLVYLAEKNSQELITEVSEAISKDYYQDLPEPLIRWAADQAFNGEDFQNAARFYDVIADEENPDLSPKEVWRFLGKSRIESGDPAGALTAIEHALRLESDPAWRADGLTDKGKALLTLKKYDEATQTAEEGLALRPEGRIGANLHMLRGDILLAQGKPEEAVRSYILPVQLMDDDDRVVKPLALHKLIQALEQANKPGDAAKYREELQQKYPIWKP
ncbi:MAG: tetratricopeptide repeat protein [Verrucomicrobiales bacterium]